MGGSTMKTAKVWKYFDQLPSEEQAAECRICCKRIKATNSSTTGMIRHLRSCHVNEYKLLQEARQSGLVVKNEEKSRPMTVKQQTEKLKPIAHGISSIIANHRQTPVVATSQQRLASQVDGPSLKKPKLDDCDAIDLSTVRRSYNDPVISNASPEKVKKPKEGFWSAEHFEAKKITNQIGLMMLLDGELPSIVDRAGFRSLIRLLQPRYHMPSGDTFQKTILPELINQLKAGVNALQQEYFQNRFNKTAQEAVKTQVQMISPEMNIVVPNVQTGSAEQTDLERVVMNSIRCAQNISQSFSHSIQLCDDDSDSSADVETTISMLITAFLERIGKYVFPQAELVDILTRCHAVIQYLEECKEFSDVLKTTTQSTDLAACVDFVQNNLEAIHSFHSTHPIPLFTPFSADETQFLSDLNAHIHTT